MQIITHKENKHFLLLIIAFFCSYNTHAQAIITPDTTIDSVLILKKEVGNDGWGWTYVKLLNNQCFETNFIEDDHFAESPCMLFTNKDTSEFLIAMSHEGGNRCFYEVVIMGRDDVLMSYPFHAITINRFTTGNGVHLGMRAEEIHNNEGYHYFIDDIYLLALNERSCSELLEYHCCSLKNSESSLKLL